MPGSPALVGRVRKNSHKLKDRFLFNVTLLTALVLVLRKGGFPALQVLKGKLRAAGL